MQHFFTVGTFTLTLVLFFAAPITHAKREEQTRPVGKKVTIPAGAVVVDDGDTVVINKGKADEETIRVLGIDTPEIKHEEHGLPEDQPHGREALAFTRGVIAAAHKVEIVRASTTDPYGRTLGYVYVNDRNLSILLLNAGLAVESVTRYGDNGLPKIAEEVRKAAASAPPVDFEDPAEFRKRFRQ